MGLTHAGQRIGSVLCSTTLKGLGFQVLRHGGNVIKLPALDFGEELLNCQICEETDA